MATNSRRAKSGNSDADRFSAAIREIQTAGGGENKKCFECEQRGPTYVDMTVGSFVCTKCSGMLRGINPPHRIKSISMSTFTADEVELIRGRGNVYCAKVWMGLYDNKGSIGNDAEAIKDFMIQKYEKKRYYVDPSTLRHSLGSTASTLSSNSQQSDGNLIPVVSSSSSILGSANVNSKGSEMIGTTIQLHKKQHNLVSQIHSSSIRNAPTFSMTPNTSLSGIQLSTPASQSFATVLPKPKPSSVATTAAVSGGNVSASTNQSSLAAYALPAPSKGKVINQQPRRSVNSGFPEVSFPPPTSKIHQKPANLQQENAKPLFTAATSSTSESNFANFDVANFRAPSEDKKGDTVMSPFGNTSQKASGKDAIADIKVAQDRYAALKDLDDIFKSTVMCDAPKKPSTSSTGASIFGTSPVASQVPMQSSVGNTVDRTMTPPPKAQAQGSISDAYSKTAHANNTGWTAAWPQDQPNNTLNTISSNNHGSSPNGFTAPSSNDKIFGITSSSASTNVPINPFTGASNLTQLNTSPWPTTGSSPVQSAANLVWPPAVSSSSKIGGDSAFAANPGLIDDLKRGTSASATNSNFADFSNVNNLSSSATINASKIATASPFPDPFGAAPNSNYQQQSDNNNDLFAKAPKPAVYHENRIDDPIGVLTSDIFGKSDPFIHAKDETGKLDIGIDPWAGYSLKDSTNTITHTLPWASSTGGGDTLTQTNGTNFFTPSMLPASKSTNPFL